MLVMVARPVSSQWAMSGVRAMRDAVIMFGAVRTADDKRSSDSSAPACAQAVEMLIDHADHDGELRDIDGSLPMHHREPSASVSAEDKSTSDRDW